MKLSGELLYVTTKRRKTMENKMQNDEEQELKAFGAVRCA